MFRWIVRSATRPKVSTKLRLAASEAVSWVASVGSLRHRHVDARPDQRDHDRRAEGFEVVIVHLVIEAAVPFSIRAGHATDLQCRAVREDDV